MVELPDYNKITFKENPAIPLEEIVPDTLPQAIDLLYKFLVYPSKQRCSAQQVRNRKWTSDWDHFVFILQKTFVNRHTEAPAPPFN